MAQFRPADHSKGDANTIGGYMAVHDRPAAFEGSDGFSYSVELMTDATGDTARPFAAYLLFVKWARIGAQTPEGHLETDYLASGASEEEARRSIGALPLSDVKRELDRLINEAPDVQGRSSRRWYDVMKDES
jgi:hypothetical protein